MPFCKNDPKSSYKGDEPSPKGLGYCAHAEKLGTKMKGKDGNMWVIKETSKKIKRWVKLSSSKSAEKKGKKYYILHNGSLPYEVIINNKNEVSIYKREKYDGRKHHSYEEYDKIPYDIFITKIKAKKIFIGKDKSMGVDYPYGKYAIGNSILLEVGNNKYVCISPSIFEFSLEEGDTFEKFSSLIVGSDNSDPILLGKNNFYSLVDLTYASRTYFPKDWKIEDGHDFYYGTWDNKKKVFITNVKEKKKLKNLKFIK